MFRINGKEFYKVPYMCGGCWFFLSYGKSDGNKDSYQGFCTLFSKKKGYYANLPKRCKDLFDKAASYPDGTDLCIVLK